MPPKKKAPPKPQHKYQAPPARAAKPKEKPAMTDMPFPPGTDVVSTANSTEAGPRSHIDEGAQNAVQEQLAIRAAMAPTTPKAPPVPPGMSPNQIVAWASVAGTVPGGGGAAVAEEEAPPDEEAAPGDRRE